MKNADHNQISSLNSDRFLDRLKSKINVSIKKSPPKPNFNIISTSSSFPSSWRKLWYFLCSYCFI